MVASVTSEVQQEASRFLDRDFNQCFQQLRHYDAQIFEIGKFVLVSYAGIIGLTLGLYEFSLKERFDLTLPAQAILGVGLLHGLLLFGMATSNRAYFVKVARYLNEHRSLFLSSHPLGFQNATQMYTNQAYPPYYDWRSSQLWLTHLVGALNSILLVLILWFSGSPLSAWTLVVAAVALLLAQVLGARAYLRSYEPKKTPEQTADPGNTKTTQRGG